MGGENDLVNIPMIAISDTTNIDVRKPPTTQAPLSSRHACNVFGKIARFTATILKISAMLFIYL